MRKGKRKRINKISIPHPSQRANNRTFGFGNILLKSIYVHYKLEPKLSAGIDVRMAQIGNSTIIPKDTIKIGDLHIQFPHVPYSCQRDFMEKVVEALNSVRVIFTDIFMFSSLEHKCCLGIADGHWQNPFPALLCHRLGSTPKGAGPSAAICTNGAHQKHWQSIWWWFLLSTSKFRL
jgi:hypothetical protein